MYDVVATSKITVGSGSSLTVTGKGRREQWCVKADLGPPDLAIIDESEVNDERGRRLMTTRVLALIMHVQFFILTENYNIPFFTHAGTRDCTRRGRAPRPRGLCSRK